MNPFWRRASLLLLDHIAQCTEPFIVAPENSPPLRLTGASDYARTLVCCPLRYVLDDDLVRTCTALGFSEGDEISGCLDLLHLPAEHLWVEWNENARRSALEQALPECRNSGPDETSRSGALIHAHRNGRSGRIQTFWLPRGSREPLLAAMETFLDLDGKSDGIPADELFQGQTVKVFDDANPQLDHLLKCVRFRFHESWGRYYSGRARDPTVRAHIVSSALSAVAFDVPLLLALFLLQSVRADLVEQAVDPGRLNAKRVRAGKPPLLSHVEVSAPVFMRVGRPSGQQRGTHRPGPRFHHVRGHIVRRRSTIYWRGPHWRGHIRLGSIRSRTVKLRLPRPEPEDATSRVDVT
jgi:hypothetical protein